MKKKQVIDQPAVHWIKQRQKWADLGRGPPLFFLGLIEKTIVIIGPSSGINQDCVVCMGQYTKVDRFNNLY